MRSGAEALELCQLILQGVKAVHKGQAVVLKVQLGQSCLVLGRRQAQPVAEVQPPLPCKWPAWKRQTIAGCKFGKVAHLRQNTALGVCAMNSAAFL